MRPSRFQKDQIKRFRYGWHPTEVQRACDLPDPFAKLPTPIANALRGFGFIIDAFRSAKVRGYGNPTRERGIAVGISLMGTGYHAYGHGLPCLWARVTIAWHDRARS